MAIIFNTPKTAINTTTRDMQNLSSDCPPCPEVNLTTADVEYTENGEYTVTPEEGYDGLTQVDITVNIPSDVRNQDKLVTPTTSYQTITADSGYSGIGTVDVLPVTSSIDSNIQPENILSGVEILGVTGTDAGYTAGYTEGYDAGQADCPTPVLETVTATYTTNDTYTITPTQGYDGIDEVTVTVNVSGGGTNCPDWSLIGYTSQDLGWLDDAVAYSKTIKDTADLGSTINVRRDEKLAFVASGGTYEYSSGAGAFNYCYGLLQVKDVTVVNPTGNNNSFSKLFSNCYGLRTVGSVTFKKSSTTVNPSSLASCFENCCSLVSVPNWNYSECQDFNNFLSWSSNTTPPLLGNLKTIPLMNMQSATRVDNMFNLMRQLNITDGISGFQYLGKAFAGTNATRHTLDLQYMPNLTKTSVMNIINNVSAPDDSTATDATLKLAAEVYALLDASDIAIATAKNWSVISA